MQRIGRAGSGAAALANRPLDAPGTRVEYRAPWTSLIGNVTSAIGMKLLRAAGFLVAGMALAVSAVGGGETRGTQAASPPSTPSDSLLERLKATMAPKLSPSLAGVEKLAKAGVGEEIVVGYIENSTTRFAPGADDILMLRQAGLSDRALVALLQRDQKLAEAQPAPAQIQPPAAVAPLVQPVPTVWIAPQPVQAAVPTVITVPVVTCAPPPPVYVQHSPNVIWVPTSYSGSWSRRLSCYTPSCHRPHCGFHAGYSTFSRCAPGVQRKCW